MGWSSSWVAVRGANKGELLASLGFEESGQEVAPGTRAAPFCCAQLERGWLVVFNEDFDWASAARVRQLSQFGLAVGCQFEDRVMMTSAACAARDGVELWRVFHDNEASIYRLDVTGEPPAELAAIRDRLFKEQGAAGGDSSSTDYVHDVPIELAKAVCGYRHDDDDAAFVGLRRTGASAVNPSRRLTFLQKVLAPLRPREWP
jgi:hypothetical protein